MRKVLVALTLALVACGGTVTASNGWTYLGRPNSDISTSVYRYCDGSVAVYVVIPNSQGVGITAVSVGPSGPCR